MLGCYCCLFVCLFVVVVFFFFFFFCVCVGGGGGGVFVCFNVSVIVLFAHESQPSSKLAHRYQLLADSLPIDT